MFQSSPMTLLHELDAATLAVLVLRHGRRRARRLLSSVTPLTPRDRSVCLDAVLAGQPVAGAFAHARRQRWLAGLPRGLARQAAWWRSHCGARGVALLGWNDPAFPESLRQIPDPPLALYLRGDASRLGEPAIALVGARRATRGALDLARQLAAGLARAGLQVVSGLAIGCDGAAHQGALDTGRTIAVLGSGLGCISPPSHRPLAAAIVDCGGTLVSEYPPDLAPDRHQFPERNRLISGLSRAVLVIEAGARSGSLITARFAAEQGREVMAVPGAVAGGRNTGGHRLLRDGAALVESVPDVLEVLGWGDGPAMDAGAPGAARPEHPLGARLLDCLEAEPLALDVLAARLGMPVRTLSAVLVDLELDGFVRRSGGGYIRSPADS